MYSSVFFVNYAKLKFKIILNNSILYTPNSSLKYCKKNFSYKLTRVLCVESKNIYDSILFSTNRGNKWGQNLHAYPINSFP